MIGKFDANSSGKCPTVKCMETGYPQKIIHVARTPDTENNGKILRGKSQFGKCEFDPCPNAKISASGTPGRIITSKSRCCRGRRLIHMTELTFSKISSG